MFQMTSRFKNARMKEWKRAEEKKTREGKRKEEQGYSSSKLLYILLFIFLLDWVWLNWQSLICKLNHVIWLLFFILAYVWNHLVTFNSRTKKTNTCIVCYLGLKGSIKTQTVWKQKWIKKILFYFVVFLSPTNLFIIRTLRVKNDYN